MQHHGNPQPRARVRGAGGEKTVLIAEHIVQSFAQLVIDLVDPANTLLEPQPGGDHLYPEMILLVHHDAYGPGRVESHPPGGLRVEVLKANEVSKWVEALWDNPDNNIVSYLDEEKKQWAISYLTGG